VQHYFFTSYAYVLPSLLGFSVLFSLSLISLLRGRKNPTNISFAGLCFLGAIINADLALITLIPDKSIALKIDRFTYFFFVFSLPVFIQFVHAFVGIKKRMWLVYLAYLCSLVFLFFSSSSLFISGLNTYRYATIARPGPVYYAFAVLTVLNVIYGISTLCYALRKAKGNEQRNRIKYILGGAGLSVILLVLNILPVLGYDVYPPGNFSFIPAIFLAIGVLKYDLLDIGAVIRRGTIYFILTILLTLASLLIIYFFNRFVLTASDNMVILPLTLSLFMVLLFNPLREATRKFIDRLFFRGRYDYQHFLKELSGEMASLLKKYQIRELLLKSLSASLQVNSLYLLLYEEEQGRFILHYSDQQGDLEEKALFDHTHPLVALLEESGEALSKIALERLRPSFKDRGEILRFFDDYRIASVVPMLSRKRLVGMIALGEKKSGELLVHEDWELLTTIANQSVTAFENASTYEKLEKMNQELEEKVAQRTAALRNTLEEKEKTQAQLVQSESLAAIGQLVAGAAHELNNPLAGASSLIQSSLETLARQGTADDELLDDLKFSLKELRRMRDIVKSLLDLSRKTQVYVEPVLVNVAIDDALRILYNQYKNLRVEVEKNYDENLPVVEGNYANLGQVFINVIKNAVQALPSGAGRIVLTTSYDQNKDSVTVDCRDTGKGIPAAHLKDIFKPFFTTKGVGEGAGLGLYISHEIVKRHGGTMEVTSVDGQGTSVSIELPCHRRES